MDAIQIVSCWLSPTCCELQKRCSWYRSQHERGHMAHVTHLNGYCEHWACCSTIVCIWAWKSLIKVDKHSSLWASLLTSELFWGLIFTFVTQMFACIALPKIACGFNIIQGLIDVTAEMNKCLNIVIIFRFNDKYWWNIFSYWRNEIQADKCQRSHLNKE